MLSRCSYGINYDVHGALDESNERYSESAAAIHENAEVFDYRAEAVFKYIQVGLWPWVALCV